MKSKTTVLPHPFPSRTAASMGQDKYGYWQTLIVHGVEVQFRWIPPGRFPMGSDREEKGRFADETPHDVRLSRGFWLASTTCTQELWTAVTGQNPSQFKGDQLPVENVSWIDICEKFLPVINEYQTDLEAGLPTEAQWEYACRSGAASAFHFGDTVTTEVANFFGIEPFEERGKGARVGQTVNVYEFEPNRWGLYQMHGNVFEWCSDWYGKYPVGEQVDPAGPAEGQARVLRGGSWLSVGRDLRAAYRYHLEPDYRNRDIGFRLSQVPRTGDTRSVP